MIEVSKEEYAYLVRSAERLDVVRRLITGTGFISDKDLKIILNIEEKEGGESDVSNR